MDSKRSRHRSFRGRLPKQHRNETLEPGRRTVAPARGEPLSISPCRSTSIREREAECSHVSIDRWIYWWMRQNCCVQWITVLVCVVILLLTPSFLFHGAKTALGHHPTTQQPPPSHHHHHHHREYYAPRFHPDHAPPIPAALDPFIQRVGFALPDQIFEWMWDGPCTRNPYATLEQLSDPNGTAALDDYKHRVLGHDSDIGLEAWSIHFYRAVAQTDAELQQLWAELIGEVGFHAFCRGDPVARAILQEQRRLSEEEEGWSGAEVAGLRESPGHWGCLWERVLRVGTGWEVGLDTDPGKKTRSVCNRMKDINTDTRRALEECADKALANQRRILDRVQQRADAESMHLLHEVVLPALETTCPHLPQTWRPLSTFRSPTSPTTCATHLLQALTNRTVPGALHPPTWAADPSDPTGLGLGQTAAERFYLRSPDRIFGFQIPSESPYPLEREHTVVARQELDGLAHEFSRSVALEMSVRAVGEVMSSWRGMCEREVKGRGKRWMFVPLPSLLLDGESKSDNGKDDEADQEDLDFSPPTLVRQILHYLASIPMPFTSPRLHNRSPAFVPNYNMDGMEAFFEMVEQQPQREPEASPSKRGKLTPSQRFWRNAMLNGSCDYLSLRPVGVPELHAVSGANIPLPSSLSQDPGSEDLILTTWTLAQESMWRYWSEGAEVQWKMTWNDQFTNRAARGEDLDLGKLMEVKNAWRGCRLRREEQERKARSS